MFAYLKFKPITCICVIKFQSNCLNKYAIKNFTFITCQPFWNIFRPLANNNGYSRYGHSNSSLNCKMWISWYRWILLLGIIGKRNSCIHFLSHLLVGVAMAAGWNGLSRPLYPQSHIPMPTVRFNLSCVCPGVYIQQELPDTALAGANQGQTTGFF